MALWSIAALSFFVGYQLTSSWFRANRPKRKQRLWSQVHGISVLTKRRKQACSVVLTICATLSLIAMLAIIARAASLGFSILAISGARNIVAAGGGGILLIILQIYKYALLIVLFLNFSSKDSVNIKLLVIHTLIVCSFDLLLGSRSSLVNGFAFPFLIGYHIFNKPIQLNKLIIPVTILAIVISPLYRSLTRDTYFAKNKGKTSQEILADNLNAIPQMLFGGYEISSLDASMDIIKKYDESETRFYGSTLAASLAAPIPRSFWPTKPYGGASTMFTETYYPTHYGEARSELLTSYTGELYMNFGTFGVAIGYLVFGSLSSSLYCIIFIRARPPSRINGLLYSVIVMRSFNLLRGDSFNFISQTITNLLPLIIAYSIYIVAYACIKKYGNYYTGPDLKCRIHY
ncbi:O-antigen polymerase [Abditibacterium utsteinense]|nr:O-antigen polymerase [Abditibacterium utsteinense]